MTRSRESRARRDAVWIRTFDLGQLRMELPADSLPKSQNVVDIRDQGQFPALPFDDHRPRDASLFTLNQSLTPT